MKLNNVDERLDLAYQMRLENLEPITPHLIGAPGVGKSTLVQEFAKSKAKQLQKEFIDFDNLDAKQVNKILKTPQNYFVFADKRLTGLDPVDLSGIPRLVNDSQYVLFLPLALSKLLESCAGLLFLDEFLNENRPNMIAQVYKVVRDYKIGDVALNRQVLVVAASNDTQHSNLSNNIPKPLRDRFDFIEVEASSIESWSLWMDKNYGAKTWDRNILAYLRWRPNDFLANISETTEDNGYEPPATPRGWSYVSLAFQKIQDPNLQNSIAKGKLGRIGETFLAFLENKTPDFNELSSNPKIITTFNIEQKYLAALTVAQAITNNIKNIEKSKKFLNFVAKKDDREFIAALFSFLEKQQRRELFLAIKDNPTIITLLEHTGKALL